MNVPQTFSIPVEVLGFPDVEVVKVVLNREQQFIITVASTKKDIPCQECGKPTEPYGKGRTIQLRHLPILGKETYIEITPPRGRCSNCKDNTTTTQQASWYDRKSPHTKAYEKHILLSLINSTLSDVSIKENLGYQAVQAIINRQISSEVEWRKIKEIGLLGIDEISLKKGYKDFVTLVTSRTKDEIKILAVLKGHEKAPVKAFLSTIPRRLRKTIAAICTDMCEGYINAAKEAFGKSIPVIIDRFHVAQLYRKSLVSIRKQELKRLRKALSEEEYRSLKPAIALLCHHKEILSQEELKIVEPLFNFAPLLRVAYKFCCQLTAIYNSHISPTEARQKINAWILAVEKSGLTCFNKFIGTLRKYQKQIENYFINRETSGFVEGFNNKAKVLKRRCYGIYNLKHFFQRLFLDFSGYAFFAKTSAGCYA